LAPAELASVFGLPGGPPGEILVMGGLLVRLLLLQLLLTAAQPLPPRAPIDEPGRQLIAARLAEPLVLGGVRPSGLDEDPLDLLTDRRVPARHLRRGIAREQ